MSTAGYPRRPSLLDPHVYSSPLVVTAAVWCFAVATIAMGLRPGMTTGLGKMTALSPLWIWNSGCPAHAQERI